MTDAAVQTATTVPAAAPVAGCEPSVPVDDGLGLVLDALGGILAALSRYPIDLPDRSGEELSRELTRWRRHATMGCALSEHDDASVGVAARDWSGVVRTVTEQRRDEHRYVKASINELRDALWACVETVHKAVQVDHAVDATTEQQMERAKTALQRMQTGSIKQEVLGAVIAIEGALRTRREQQQEQYVSLGRKLEGLSQQLEEARRECTTDALTGLGNRKHFDIVASRARQMHSLGRQPVALLMVDIDRLKLVNDLYGHQSGDAAIVNLGKALARTFLRSSDVLCRLGGDEFAVILFNTDWKMALTLAKRLQEQLSLMPAPHQNMEFAIGASVGVAQLEGHEEVADWVSRADKALYKAKQHARERVCVADGLSLPTD
ncbi:GGDEF domain-containing protein [Gemmatimonas sp.]|uniref:GGDEF domain-containing protein n=1 Tax=Gemmatimonas sp. TaxID=1962908 RepID=UPI0022C57B33|nr:GGDEF domain-containing protein [Gemmatimonas sp.]MCZ8205937.1 GGDEF domain-containing protein [Gemmatimonas sp.]